MNLDRYEESTERKRLTGHLQPRAVQTGLSSAGMFLFGLPFLGVGIWATLAGTKTIPIDPAKLHAPHWVLAVFGGVFALAGVMLWSLGGRQWRANRRKRDSLANKSRDPALADYAWNPRGFTPPRWSRAAKTLGGVIFFAIFLSIFNWWAFFTPSPWLLKAIVGLFNLILIFVAWQAGMVLGRTLKFGPSQMEFAKFPFRPGETAVLRWRVPNGISRITKGTFTLRCVEEWYEVSGSGKNRSRTLVQEQVWRATGHVGELRGLLPGKTEELQFDIPADTPSTSLSGDKTVFWELAVDLDLAGLDFKETYMVPVYRAGSA